MCDPHEIKQTFPIIIIKIFFFATSSGRRDASAAPMIQMLAEPFSLEAIVAGVIHVPWETAVEFRHVRAGNASQEILVLGEWAARVLTKDGALLLANLPGGTHADFAESMKVTAVHYDDVWKVKVAQGRMSVHNVSLGKTPLLGNV